MVGHDQHRRHRVRPHLRGARRADDAGSGVLLRWPRAPQELPGDHDAVVHLDGRRDHDLGVLRLLARLLGRRRRASSATSTGRCSTTSAICPARGRRPSRRRRTSSTRRCSPSSPRRSSPAPSPTASSSRATSGSSCSGASSSTSRSCTGSGAAAGSRSTACLTGPAAPSCT